MNSSSFWLLFTGLALFLYGMLHLEDGLKEIEGRRFKLFLRKYTKNKLSAILSGTLVTAILQSSSVVNLMLLSLVGAGTLSMRNALAVVLGSNIGGTFNSWLVAWLGFKANLGDVCLPLIAISGIGLIVLRNRKKISRFFKISMGLGLLLYGLELMKGSMKPLLDDFDFTPYLGYSGIVFVIIGFCITALVQTSAATVAIVLSALNAGIIPLETAVAIVLGAELGTTIKILIGSVGGSAAKKRLAFGNIIFNVITSTFGFLLLTPIIYFIQNVIGLKDTLLVMVAFQTFINITGAVVFYFFLEYFGNFLENYIHSKEKNFTSYINNASAENPELTVDLFEKETSLFIYRVILLNMEGFSIEPDNKHLTLIAKEDRLSSSMTFIEKYDFLKQSEGEILARYSEIQASSTDKETLLRLNRLISSVRNAMYSAKGMKDIRHNEREFSNSGNETKYKLYKLQHSQLKEFYTKLSVILSLPEEHHLSELRSLFEFVQSGYGKRAAMAFSDPELSTLKKIDVASLFNINREIFSSSKAIVLSLKDYLLEEETAESFENLTEAH
jgi:phosphate:Na+ symporter